MPQKCAALAAVIRLAGAFVEGSSNKLLKSLSLNDCSLLRPLLEQVDLVHSDRVEVANTTVAHAYFVETGMISMVATSHNHRIEVGMIGFEGMTGTGLLNGVSASPNEALVQTPGIAWRIKAIDLNNAMEASASLRNMLRRYLQTFTIQITQTALANGRGTLEQRLARWILMWSDRLRSTDLPITHEFLALLLGVRRQSATVSLHGLEGRLLIRSERGTVHVRDREGLKLVADGLYGVSEAEYDRIMDAPVVTH